MRQFLDLVAIGTIADLVPLERENRILASQGLKLLAQGRRPGLVALLDRAGVRRDQAIDEQTVGWKIAPRLNAPGRLGDAEPALALLLASTPAEGARAADVLEEANQSRRAEQTRVSEQAAAILTESAPGAAVVVAATGWKSGVVGIVASRLVEQYHRPAFVIAIDPDTGEGRGSARSFGGVNLYECLAEAAATLDRFGGHAAAAGFTVKPGRLDELRELLSAAVASRLANVGEVVLEVDAEVALSQIDERLAHELETLAPFGKGNEQPLLLGRGLRVHSTRRVGDGSHLKVEFVTDNGAKLSGIAFGLGDKDPGSGATIDAVFAPNISTWGGRRKVELIIRQFEVVS